MVFVRPAKQIAHEASGGLYKEKAESQTSNNLLDLLGDHLLVFITLKPFLEMIFEFYSDWACAVEYFWYI